MPTGFPARTLEGVGLFTGARCRVRLVRDGARHVRLRLEDGEPVVLAGVTLLATDRRVVVGAGGARVELVEHLAGALAGLGVHDGLCIEVSGPELPLLGGGASELAAAIVELDVPPSPTPLVVVRHAELRVGESRYVFAPGRGVVVEVAVDFGIASLARDARWTGEADDFVARIAPARTFVLAREIAALADRGLAAHADPRSVVVLDEGGAWSSEGRVAHDEPARHKLLDLLGDLYLAGGTPRGTVRAERPGHTASHEALRRALAEGVVEPAS